MSVYKREILLVIVSIILMILVLYASGCYGVHVAEPCDSGVLPDSSMVERPTVNREDAGSSPALAAVCEGGLIVAYYGCALPGSYYWEHYIGGDND